MIRKFKSHKRTRTNFNFGKVSITIALIFAMLMQGFAVPVSADPVTKTMTVTFPSSLSQTRSQDVNIPNLKSIQSISSSTGTATYTISGENVTVNVSGGTASGTQWNPTKLSKTGTKTLTSMTNNLASTYAYNDGTYSGTIPSVSSGSGIVQTGGSYTPSDSFTASSSQSGTAYQDNTGTYWSAPSSMSYNSGGYSGTLYLTSESDGAWIYQFNGGGTAGPTYAMSWTAYYSGTVSRPASDTRTYGTQYYANYSGTVYAGAYDNLYGYTVTLNYVDNSNSTLTTTLPSENSYFGKESGYNAIFFSGSVHDDDAADTVTAKYTLTNNTTGTDLTGHTNIEVMTPVISNGLDHSFNYTINIDETIPDGRYTLKVWAEDDKGGVSATKSTNIIVDRAAPSINAPIAIAATTTQITVTPDAEDDLTGLHEMPYMYNRNGVDISLWIDGSLFDTELTPNTQYTYKYKARDAIGSESDYSEAEQRYTLALDPTGVQVKSSTTESIILHITNDEQNGEPPETFIEVRSKSDGTVITTSDWSVETERVLDGLSLDTEYELWVKARNGDGVENEFLKVQNSFYSNQTPKGTIIEPTENRMIAGSEIFNLSGKAWDQDQDDLTISVIIDGVEKKALVSAPPFSTPEESNWSIEFQGSELGDGIYTEIVVTVADSKGAALELPLDVSLTVDKTPPAANTPTVTVDSTTQIIVAPAAEDSMTGLQMAPYLYNRNGEDIGPWMAESFVDTELTPNTQYTYKYKARDVVGNESEYSEEVSKYTLALNPAEVQITSSTTDSISAQIANDGQNGITPETYIEVRSKSDGTVIAASDWSAEKDRTLIGLSLNTEYELWFKARNGDGVENGFVKVQDSFYSNRSPQGEISEPIENKVILGQDAYILSGKAWDTDQDHLTISVTIGDVEKAFEMMETPSGEPVEDNWSVSFQGEELADGIYSDTIVKLTDTKGTVTEVPLNYSLTLDKTPPVVNTPTVTVESTTQITVAPEAEDSMTELGTVPYLYNRNGEDIGTWMAELFLDTELTPNTKYTYKYKARDAVGNESEYSEEVSKYTLALNPAEVQITSSTTGSISVQITNDGQNGITPETYIEVRSKSDGTVIATSDWSAEEDRMLTGLSLNTEYELWLKARNGDGVENGLVKVQDSFYSNRLHQGNLSGPEGDGIITENLGQQSFTLFGKAWDLDQDKLTVSVTFGNVEKTIEITETPPGEPAEDNWSISFSGGDLPNGSYNNISIKIKDGKGEEINLPFEYSLTVAVTRIVKIEIEPHEVRIPVGQSQKLKASVFYSNGFIETTTDITDFAAWTSSNQGIATVNQGNVLGCSQGQTSIQAKLEGIIGTVQVEVSAPIITRIELLPERTVAVGNACTLTATAYFSDGTAKDITQSAIWSSLNQEIASANLGTIIGLKQGVAIIQVEYNGSIGTVQIEVKDPVITNVEIINEKPVIAVGDTVNLMAKANYSDRTVKNVTQVVSWTSLNPDIASVNRGIVTGISHGTTTIQAELEGKIGAVQVEVTHVITINLESEQSQLQRGESLFLKAIAHYSDNKMVNVTNMATWSSLNPEIISVDGTGKITALSEGRAIVQAEFEGKLATVEITVTDPAITYPSNSVSSDPHDHELSRPPTTNPELTNPTPGTPPVTSIPDTPKPTVPETTVPENVPDLPQPPKDENQISQPETGKPSNSKPTETTPTVSRPSYGNRPYGIGNQPQGNMKGNTKGNTKGNANLSTHTVAQLPDFLRNLPTRTTETGVIKGYVKDAQGNPIADTRIELHSTPRITFTDSHGFFRFDNVEMGAHKIYLADEKISKNLVLLNSITVIDSDQVKSMTGDQVAYGLGDNGIVETAQVQLSANDSLKELEIIVDMNSKGKGKGFSLKSLLPENIPAAAALAGGIGLSGSMLVIFVLFKTRRNASIYVGSKCIRRRRVKLTQGELTLELRKEFLKSNGDNLRIVFSKSLSRKLAGKSITITEAGEVVTRLIAPEFTGGSLEIEVETLGE